VPPVVVAIHVLLHLVDGQDHVCQREQPEVRRRRVEPDERPRPLEPDDVHVGHHRVQAGEQHLPDEDLLDEPHPQERARGVAVVRA